MDDNYMRHTCLLMGWRIESIKVSSLPPMPPPAHYTYEARVQQLIRASTQSTLALPSGQTPLNAGYCFITFPVGLTNFAFVEGVADVG